MYKKQKVSGVILSAGNSTRYNRNVNKNFELINNKPVLLYSLIEFDQNPIIDEMIIVYKKDDKNELIKIIKENKFNKKIILIEGGNTRKESVFNAINKIINPIVVIHDGARPLIKQELINEVVKQMDLYKASSVGIKSKDTIKIVSNDNIVKYSTNRDNTMIIQTPQCFNRELLLKLHKKYRDIEATDDCFLFEMDNYEVKIVNGDYTNIKITTYEDYLLLNTIVELRSR